MSDNIVNHGEDYLLRDENEYVVETESCGNIRVYVQGELCQGKCPFITVHDLGTNHRSMIAFVNSPAMGGIKKESCFLHVIAPGHEENAPNLRTHRFPSLKIFGQELIAILNYFHIESAIAIGDGAGAIVLSHLSLLHAYRIRALILVNCAAIVRSSSYLFPTHYSNWRGKEISPAELGFLQYHKNGVMALMKYESIFSFNSQPEGEYDLIMASIKYKTNLREKMNTHNVKLYVRAFLTRSRVILQDCRSHTLFVAGKLSPYASLVSRVYENQNDVTSRAVKVEDVCDVIAEAPGIMARTIIDYCQSHGLLMTLSGAGFRQRYMSFTGTRVLQPW